MRSRGKTVSQGISEATAGIEEGVHHDRDQHSEACEIRRSRHQKRKAQKNQDKLPGSCRAPARNLKQRQMPRRPKNRENDRRGVRTILLLQSRQCESPPTRLFVQWASGKCRPVHAPNAPVQELRPVQRAHWSTCYRDRWSNDGRYGKTEQADPEAHERATPSSPDFAYFQVAVTKPTRGESAYRWPAGPKDDE